MDGVESSPRMEDLLAIAVEARLRAYAPYSGYKVGAALLTTGGRVYQGCNVENASYGLTTCAERVALFCAVAAGERRFETLVVVSDTEEPAPPCGACLQALAEFSPDMTIVAANLSGDMRTFHLADLLPRPFTL